jgi:transmembrane sensor
MRFLRTRGRIRREAADWVARLGGGADEGEHAAFRRWHEADPRHAEAYDRLAAIWSAAGRLERSPGAERSATISIARTPRFRFAMAASIVAAVALVSILMLKPNLLSRPSGGQEISLVSAMGEIKQVDLPDGSRVVLDSGSRIEARFSAAERRLTLLEGRARFIVAHEVRPFIVSAVSNEVVATGTVFDVSLIHDRLAVVLLEGSVEVRSVGSPRRGVHRLAAGQRLLIRDNAQPVTQSAPRGEALWVRRMLEFDDTPLDEAAAVVNRYSRVQLRLADEHVRSLRISGAYRAGDVAGFARSLAAAFGLRLETQPDGNLLVTQPAGSPH